MKAKIDSVKPTRTFGDPPRQVYEVVAAGIVYDCFDAKIKDMAGQEVEFEVKAPSDPKYHPTMRLAGENRSQGFGNMGRKGFTIAFGQTAEGEKLRTRSMVLSYAKDIGLQASKKDAPFSEVLTNIKSAYEVIIPLLQLDQIKDSTVQPQSGNGHKTLQNLLTEMKPITSLDVLATWWKGITPSFSALSGDDQKTLIAEKDKKKIDLTPPQNGSQTTGRQAPF